jgi:putative PIN family toxin of toxin-antitoxin system
MIYLQAAGRNAGPSFACMELVDRDLVQLYVSDDVLAEVNDVLTRPEIARKFPDLTPERVSELLQRIEDKAVQLRPIPQRYSLPRDPKDEPYLNLAIAANAEFLITRDKDLLDLMNDNTESGKSFRAQYDSITIIDPVELLRMISEQRNPPNRPAGT